MGWDGLKKIKKNSFDILRHTNYFNWLSKLIVKLMLTESVVTIREKYYVLMRLAHEVFDFNNMSYSDINSLQIINSALHNQSLNRLLPNDIKKSEDFLRVTSFFERTDTKPFEELFVESLTALPCLSALQKNLTFSQAGNNIETMGLTLFTILQAKKSANQCSNSLDITGLPRITSTCVPVSDKELN